MKAVRFFAVLSLMVGITFGQRYAPIDSAEGTIIGAIVGAVFGAMFIAGLVLVCWRRYCWRRSQQPQMAPGQIEVVQPSQNQQYPPPPPDQQQMQHYPPGQYVYPGTGQYYPAPQQPYYGAPTGCGQPPVVVGQPVYPPPPAYPY